MAQIKLNQELTTIEGKSLPEPLTVQGAIVNALLAADSTNLTVDEKIKRYQLAKKIQLAGEAVNGENDSYVDLSLDERAAIKSVCGVVYTPLIVGQLAALLEG